MTNRMLRKSSGVALVTAIFLLVVLAGLGVAAVSLTTTQQTASAQDELGARAYQAARAGMEWALFSQLQNGGAGLACPGAATFVLPRDTTLSTFTVTVSCGARSAGLSTTSVPDPTAGHYTITSTACNGTPGAACPAPSSSPDYIQRTIQTQL
ncbi:MAG: agglutinin biogenesis protein MshP [Duganella sp.]